MIGQPLSDQALRFMDAFVESVLTRTSNDGAEGTAFERIFLMKEKG